MPVRVSFFTIHVHDSKVDMSCDMHNPQHAVLPCVSFEYMLLLQLKTLNCSFGIMLV
jgi:hypothetical protein